MPIIEEQGDVDAYVGRVPAQPDAHGYASMMGKQPSDDFDAPFDWASAPKNTVPPEARHRIVFAADGSQQIMLGDRVVATIPAAKAEVNRTAGAVTGEAEISKGRAAATVSAWQLRKQEREARAKPPVQIVVDPAFPEGSTWWAQRVAMPTGFAMASVASLDPKSGQITFGNREEFVVAMALLFQSALVKGPGDRTAFFADLDEALDFVDHPEFADDAMELLKHIIEEVQGGFLKRMMQGPMAKETATATATETETETA